MEASNEVPAVKQVNKSQPSNIKNIFQRGFKSKSASSDLQCDPSEFQRVSFATSIDELPERPSAFKQVLRQIGASRNPVSGAAKMKRVHSFKRLSKDNRSNSPQGRMSVGSTSSAAPNSLEIINTRPRSSSSSSYGPSIADIKSLVADDSAVGTKGETRSSSDGLFTASNQPISAGAVLNEFQPSVAGVQMTATTTDTEINNTSYDVVDGSPALNEVQRSKQMVEHIQQKILKISEAIKLEQSTRDENVSEYLKLASNADKQQAARIKSVFEKKNQKSNATITQLKKKFDSYQRRLREVESSGVGGRQSKSALRDVGANLRDFSGGLVDGVKGGLSGLQQATQNAAGAIAFKPKDFASRLKSKFGSADNLSSLKFDEQEADIRYGSADDVSSTSGSIDIGMAISNEDQAAHNSILSGPDSPISGGLNRRSDSQYVQSLVALKAEIQEAQTLQQKFLNEWEEWKSMHQQCAGKWDEWKTSEQNITSYLQDERFRYERLEGQVNDLTELHQREISNLKQELFSMEEKMEYQARERARDMQEAIESCQTRLSKMELQQQQQLVSVDGLENATARALLGKLINLLLSVMAVLLVLVSTVSGLLKPLTRSPIRIASTIVAVGAIIITYKNWVPILALFTFDESSNSV